MYRIALERFTPDEIAEALAAARGVTIPSQLRRCLAEDDRDLVAEFARRAPARQRIRVQRWSLRRLALISAVAGSTLVALTVAIQNLEPAGFGPP